MQPTYLPWPGFFNLMKSSDIFIFLDDVKLEKSSWHVRNKIPINNKEKYITITLDASRLGTIQLSNLSTTQPWRKKHLAMLSNNYNKSPFGKEILDLINPIINNEEIEFLGDFNIKLITEISKKLNIKCQLFKSSDLNIPGKRTDRLINFCEHFKVQTYLSPVGAKEYLEADGNFQSSPFTLEFQDFSSTPYSQFNTESFIPYLSIVDLVANIGFEKASHYIQA